MSSPWISSADVQAWIGTSLITLNDAEILAQMATDAVMALIERDLSLQTNFSEVFDTNGTDYVLVSYWPVRSISSVTLNGVAVPPAAYTVPGYRMDKFQPRKLQLAGYGKLTRGQSNLTVVYTAGYDTSQPYGSSTGLPGHVYQALRMTCSAIFNSSAIDPNLASESTGGVFGGSFVPTGAGAVPPGARTLLLKEMRGAP